MGTIGTGTGTYLAAKAASNEVKVHSSGHKEGGEWALLVPVQVPYLAAKAAPNEVEVHSSRPQGGGGMGTIGTGTGTVPCCEGGSQ